MTGTSLINFGDLTKPATVLIEKVSDAIGGLAKPWQIGRVANAEARAEIVRAEAQIEISEIERRAMVRLIKEEGKKQENIENITEKAIPHLKNDSKPEEMETDWISYFFERSRLVSDEKMQNMWARALSGQANGPGTFSKRAIDILSSLDTSDAELFKSLSGTLVKVGARDFCVVHDTSSKILGGYGLDFESFSHLENLGLIHVNAISNYGLEGATGAVYVTFENESIWLTVPQGQNRLQIGEVMLTKIGSQVMTLVDRQHLEGYQKELLEGWSKEGYNPTLQSSFVSPKYGQHTLT